MVGRGINDFQNCQTYSFFLTRQLVQTIKIIRQDDISELTLQKDVLKEGLRRSFSQKYFKQLIRALIFQHKNQIKPPSLTHSMFGFPPIQVSRLEKVPVLVADPSAAFTVIFPSGHEMKEVSEMALVFLAILVLSGSAGIAGLVTAVLQLIGQWMGGRVLIQRIQQQTGINRGFIEQ